MEFDEFRKAFEFYNNNLFENALPSCVITISRQKKVRGFYSKNRFIKGKKERSEISLNPDYFGMMEVEQVLSTLVHEMVHMKMDIKGNKSSTGYHDKKWAEEMMRIGLIPTDTGKKGGKMTGYAVTQIIDKNGLFQNVTDELIKKGFAISMFDRYYCKEKKESINENLIEKKEEKLSGKRFKYCCGCSNIWGKKNLSVRCNICGNDFQKEERK